MEQGEIEGRRHLLLELLTHRFGDIPAQTRDIIAAATPADISTWSRRLVRDNPTTIDDVIS